MKQLLFIIITFMFVSNIYAQETTIKETCAYHEKQISAVMDFIISMDKLVNKEIFKEDTSVDQLSIYNEQQDEAEDALVKASKIYHYLNCSNIKIKKNNNL